MRLQQDIWEAEHSNQASLPSLAAPNPSIMVIQFAGYLREQDIPLEGRVVDIGCGRGRNTAYLAEQGLEVYALDYIELAIEGAKTLVASKALADKAHFEQAAIDEPWPYPNNYFDFAVDSYSSIDIETLQGRTMCRDEMLRTLKPGGYGMVAVVSIEDEWEAAAYASNPGPEPNSVIWPETGKFQKDYDEAELRQFYSNFTIVALKKVEKKAVKLGKEGTATDFWLVVQKPETS